MHAHPAEVVAEARLHKRARAGIQRLAGRSQYFVDNGRRFAWHCGSYVIALDGKMQLGMGQWGGRATLLRCQDRDLCKGDRGGTCSQSGKLALNEVSGGGADGLFHGLL